MITKEKVTVQLDSDVHDMLTQLSFTLSAELGKRFSLSKALRHLLISNNLFKQSQAA